MAESAVHARLVKALIAYADMALGGLANVSVRDDAVRPLRGERPPRVNGYVPDLYAIDVPTTATLIGEAKTKADLENEHSRRQINAFLAYLARTPNGIFVLSVPLPASMAARRLLVELKAPFHDARTRTVVIDGLGAKQC
ncbi:MULTISPECIES: hypothetical protein [unclassified Mesorhizobium]|uniref:hypothetical protein n=1 Tax=unclassified Mesorhizobium TaxID=325217 RepID=UPI0003CE55AE|nr:MULTISPECIES: hypothetical protein [unclassified Mesorhizobium]ESY22452.1 hypothetical protein X751_08680 [Mesorhizobium sp. LNJC395A00]WJI76748.1 hypothetical protein NLY37_08630 [Mesorhizobium sp. C395A]